MKQFDYVKAANVSQAISEIAKTPSARFIAGGTNLIDLMKKGVTSPDKLIDITGLALTEIVTADGKIVIGALALNSTAAENALILQHLPLLSMALNAGASPQLRNMATVGGNLLQRTRCTYFYDIVMPCNKREPGSGCGAKDGYNRMHAIFGHSDQCIAVHPSDMCVALAALEAVVIVEGAKNKRRIPFQDFHTLPGTTPSKDNTLAAGEIITGVEVPLNNFSRHVHYVKIRDRASYAFALISVAAALELDGKKIVKARLAMGGVAHKPWRLFKAEDYLKGKDISLDNFKAAAELEMNSAKAFEHNAFKLKMAPNAIAEALNKASGLST